jgi:hypothetical protein
MREAIGLQQDHSALSHGSQALLQPVEGDVTMATGASKQLNVLPLAHGASPQPVHTVSACWMNLFLSCLPQAWLNDAWGRAPCQLTAPG